MTILEKQLKELQKIEPDRGFVLATRESFAGIRPSFKMNTWESLSLSFSLVLTALLVVFVINNNQQAYSIADLEALEQETQVSNNLVNVTLAEIDYPSEVALKTALALDEASTNGPAHLNSSLLKKEIQELDINPSTNQEIDNLLNQAIL